MALDHTRFFFLRVDALDINNATVPIFFTRILSHLCAPAFILLAGISAYLVKERKGLKDTSIKLLKRGCWLILLEITFVRNGFGYFDLHYIVFQVIFVIGMSMILLSAIMFLPRNVILILSLSIIFTENLLDNISTQNFNQSLQNAFIILFQGGKIQYFNNYVLDVWYPVIPWPAVMFLGYYLGGLYSKTKTYRTRFLIISGSLALSLFLILRFFNLYGGSLSWDSSSSIKIALFTFFKCSKYPPSLHFLLLTLSAALILLGILEKFNLKEKNILVFFGKCSLLFYVTHLYILSLTKRFFGVLVSRDFTNLALLKVYLIWIVLIALMYFICSKYNMSIKSKLYKG